MATARTVKTSTKGATTAKVVNQVTNEEKAPNLGLAFTLFDRRVERTATTFLDLPKTVFLDFPRMVEALLEGVELEVFWTSKGVIRNRIMPTTLGIPQDEEEAFQIIEKLEETWLQLSEKAGTDLYGNLRLHQSPKQRLETRQASRREAFLAMRKQNS